MMRIGGCDCRCGRINPFLGGIGGADLGNIVKVHLRLKGVCWGW